jgi:uncharacterized protein
MNFKERLALLDPKKNYAVQRNGAAASDDACLLPGNPGSNDCGSYWQIRTELSLAHRHGHFTLGNFLERTFEHLRFAAKRRLAHPICPRNLLFMDTETTGLAGGTGTMAFLVGIGYFGDDGFIIEQYFVRRFAEERAVLAQFLNLLERTAGAQGALVTFNGKCYDLPLLYNRAVLQRFPVMPVIDVHIDLLYPARRLWRRHLPDCALKTLERAVSGVVREGDVPACLIPERYFRYLRTADPTPLKEVFYHNQLDIVSMVAVLDAMLLLFAQEPEGACLPADRLSLVRLMEEVDRDDMSLAVYDTLLAAHAGEPERKEILLRKARLHKRKGNVAEAVSLWEEALGCGGFSAEPYEELAKIHEHRLADLGKARDYTERALEQAALVRTLRPERLRPGLQENLLERLRRIKRKQHKQGMSGA